MKPVHTFPWKPSAQANMDNYLEFIQDLIDKNWGKAISGVLLMAVGWYFGKLRARRAWAKKEFYNRINISLNILKPGEPLRIRTLCEMSCEEVFLNLVAVDTVSRASRQTTEKDPILPLPKDDYWYYLNAVLNEISERFSEGQIRREMGLPVTVRNYLITLTCEAAGDVRTRKVRAMVVGKDLLENLPAEPPVFEHPLHNTRWQTLQFLAKAWKEKPYQFLSVEICV